MPTSLESLLQHPSLWRAGGQTLAMRPALPTGFAELDARLPGGGWPCPALVELLVERCGLGEIALLIPALRELQRSVSGRQSRAIAWLNPPFIPYAPALAQRGLDLRQQLVTVPLSSVQTLWAMEQALRSGACAAVLGWADKASTQALRRLKLAAMEGGSLGVLFRTVRRRTQPSPANVRLVMSRAEAELRIELLKVQRGRPAVFALQDPQHVAATTCA